MPETGPRAARAWLAATLAFAASFWVLDLAVLRAGVPDPLDDIWEYGAVARSLLAGQGFRTGVIHPPLWTLRDAHETVPVLIHGPLLPMLLAPALRLAGPGTLDHAAWLGALLALFAAWAVYRLGAARFGPAVGAAAAALFTVSPLTLQAVHHDLSLPLGAGLLALAIERLLAPRPRAFAAGLLLGLATLARPEMLIAAAILCGLAGRVWWRLALGVIACALPWWLHTARAVGAPFFNLSSYLLVGYWGAHPGLGVLRDFDLPPVYWPELLRQALPALPAKWADFFPHAAKRALLTPSGATGWLAIVGAISIAREHRRLAATALALVLVPVAIMTATLYDTRYLAPFLPLWTLGVALGARALAERLPPWAHRPRLWIGALALLTLPATGPAMREATREARALERGLAAEREALAPLAVPVGASVSPMFSDTPDFVAWTTGRPVVWLTRDEFQRLPAAGEPNPLGLPVREAGTRTWFHAAASEAPAP